MIAVFAFSDKIKAELKDLLADEAIRDYRDDINRQNIIDWFQETVSVSLTRSCRYQGRVASLFNPRFWLKNSQKGISCS